MQIRRFTDTDWPAVWDLLQATFASGDTYAFAPDSSEAEIHRAWIEALLGTYLLKPNQPGLGGHVCNCGYVVAPAARGRGVATALCEHSQQEAMARGYRAMQFNLVVSTNTRAVRLWQSLGFGIVGTLPGAFRHRELGFVDAHVMFKTLVSP
jgi:ribosomal protein S18 acetylase RimI-like enzyme